MGDSKHEIELWFQGCIEKKENSEASETNSLILQYRVSHQLWILGLVDFDM